MEISVILDNETVMNKEINTKKVMRNSLHVVGIASAAIISIGYLNNHLILSEPFTLKELSNMKCKEIIDRCMEMNPIELTDTYLRLLKETVTSFMWF